MNDIRPTRLRRTQVIRDLVRETVISMNDIIYPIFIVDGKGVKEQISSMKGQYHYSVDTIVKELPRFKEKGIKSLLLFGIPDDKDIQAACAYDNNGVVQKALRAIKEADDSFYLVTDVCLCQYKSDGHCCFFDEEGNIKREKTLETLSAITLSHVRAGADMVAPSDMMDGRIGSMRQALDEKGFEHIPIMAYSAKYASSFYGPFRDAAHSAPAFGDRRAYQMDPANGKEASLEFQLDLNEGADILMVKPAMPYLDIIKTGAETMPVPIAAYQVSGEYSMLKNAVDSGLMDEKAIYESLIAIKRSGASIIITYFAPIIDSLVKKYQ